MPDLNAKMCVNARDYRQLSNVSSHWTEGLKYQTEIYFFYFYKIKSFRSINLIET